MAGILPSDQMSFFAYEASIRFKIAAASAFGAGFPEIGASPHTSMPTIRREAIRNRSTVVTKSGCNPNGSGSSTDGMTTLSITDRSSVM